MKTIKQNHSNGFQESLDACEDPDNDYLYNIHEYWAQTDPFTADPMEYAMQAAAKAVDDRIAGKNPATALKIFTTQNYAATNYVRNTNSWAYPYDLSGVAVGNSASAVYYASTLITPRHVLMAAHFDDVPIGGTIRFVDMNNQVEERILIGKNVHPDYDATPGSYPDLTVGLLDAALPTNRFHVLKVLPDNYADYIHTGRHIPCIRLNREKKSLAGDIEDVNSDKAAGKWMSYFLIPQVLQRHQFYAPLEGGDSGNPAFLVLNGETILLTVWTGGGSGNGTSIVAFKADINQLMQQLGGDEQLMEFDMSAFRKVNN